LYDEETLAYVLKECGFEPKRVSFQYSGEDELKDLDIRSPQTGVSLYYECFNGSGERKDNLVRSISFLAWLKRIFRW